MTKELAPVGKIEILDPLETPQLQILHFTKKDTEQNLLDFLLKNRIPISHSCQGNGTCTTCLIKLEGDLKELPPRNDLEEEHKLERGFKPNERLACQLPLINGLKLLKPEISKV